MIALCAVTALSAPAGATSYYLAPGGDDAGPGTADRPWATLEHACAEATPGDTVVLTPGEYAGELRPAHSGEEGVPITFRAEPRRAAVLLGVQGSEEAYAAVLSGLGDIRLEGLVIRTSEPRGRWARVDQCRRIVLDDLLMEDTHNSLGLHVTGCSDLRLSGCDIRLARSGSMVRIEGSRRVVIEGCAFSRGAHDALLIWPDRTNSEFVLRGNVLHPNTGRSMLIDAADRVLFEDSIIVRSDDGGRSGSSRFAFDTSNSIFRHNRIYDNWGSNLMIAGAFRDTLDFRSIRFYGNVFDNNTAMAADLYAESPLIEDCVFANNVFSANDFLSEKRQFRVRGGEASDVIFTHNLISGSIYYRDDVLSPHDASATAPGVFVSNLAVAPEFRDASNRDYRPAAGGPLVDAGRTFTRAASSGSGRLLRVEDSRWFYDGFGIEGERGDEIAVGPDRQRARIVAIDHDASMLRLDRPLRWRQGDVVSLPFSGSAPEIGAYELGDGGRAAVQVLAEPQRAAPGEPVRLRAVLHGGLEPAEIRWLLGDGEIAEGEEVTKVFPEPYDYPVRVAVTDADGFRHWGAAYVLVEEERPADAPLMRSTFGESDEDAWWRWMCYRPMPQAHEFLPGGPTGEGILHVFAREDGYQLSAQTQPQGWDLDRYPHVMIRYRIARGTPLMVSVFGWATSSASRGVRVAQTQAGGLAAEEVALAEPLLDDGEWHELRFNAAELLREACGDDLKIAKLLSIRATDTALVRTGHEYFLDEVIIGPAP